MSAGRVETKRAAQRRYRERHRERRRREDRERKKKGGPGWRNAENSRLMYAYGITLIAYEARLAEQQGVCAVCGKAEGVFGRHGEIKKLAVDHNHITGEVRDLLCDVCNRTIGMLETGRASMAQLGEYIARWAICQ